jgi:hypothetical protein
MPKAKKNFVFNASRHTANKTKRQERHIKKHPNDKQSPEDAKKANQAGIVKRAIKKQKEA